MAPNPLNQVELDESCSRTDVTKFLFQNEPTTDMYCKTSCQNEIKGMNENYEDQHLLSPSKVKIEQSSDQHCYNASQMKCRGGRKNFKLPTHGRKICDGKRRRQKRQSSLESLFEDEEHEMCFRFGASYKEFVLPLAVEPTPSAKQRCLARAGYYREGKLGWGWG